MLNKCLLRKRKKALPITEVVGKEASSMNDKLTINKYNKLTEILYPSYCNLHLLWFFSKAVRAEYKSLTILMWEHDMKNLVERDY